MDKPFGAFGSHSIEDEKPPQKPKKSTNLGMVKSEVKVKKATVEPQPPVALKSCVVRDEGREIRLEKGQPVTGLSSKTLKRLKAHKFIQ